MSKAIQLIDCSQRKAICERTARYAVMFRGEEYCELYFNTHGWVGYLPAHCSDSETGVIGLNIGEKGISIYKKEIAALNREWAEIDKKKGLENGSTT